MGSDFIRFYKAYPKRQMRTLQNGRSGSHRTFLKFKQLSVSHAMEGFITSSVSREPQMRRLDTQNCRHPVILRGSAVTARRNLLGLPSNLQGLRPDQTDSNSPTLRYHAITV